MPVELCIRRDGSRCTFEKEKKYLNKLTGDDQNSPHQVELGGMGVDKGRAHHII